MEYTKFKKGYPVKYSKCKYNIKKRIMVFFLLNLFNYSSIHDNNGLEYITSTALVEGDFF